MGEAKTPTWGRARKTPGATKRSKNTEDRKVHRSGKGTDKEDDSFISGVERGYDQKGNEERQRYQRYRAEESYPDDRGNRPNEGGKQEAEEERRRSRSPQRGNAGNNAE